MKIECKSLLDLIKQKDDILRNISLLSTDIDNNYLTESFFKKTDISENRKTTLKQIENSIKILQGC